VIGLGAGVTAGALAIAADVERITIAEIEPLVPRFVAGYFADFNHQITANPKATLVIDDARHFLLTTDQTFDVITSDMVDPWVKGTAALFTREFFELARRRLNPGGIMTLFVQLYQSNLETVKSEVGTLIDVFPNTVVWGNTNNGQGYDLVLTAQVEPVRIDVDALQARLQSPAQARVAESLRDIGMSSAVDLLSTFAGSAADLTPWLRDAVINRDRHLRLQYLAGMGLHLAQSEPIYAGMLQYARFPSDVFVGSAATIQTLKDGIARTRR
jgi:spermidine synthase